MSQSSKSAYFQAVKAAGVPLEQHYREYTTEQLKAIADQHGIAVTEPAPATPAPPAREDDIAEVKEQIAGLGDVISKLAALMAQQIAPAPKEAGQLPQKIAPSQPAPVRRGAMLDPREHAGVTLNTHAVDEVLRVDEQGNQWYQNEVNKPGYAKPRGRRVLRDMAPDTVKQTITTSDGYTETFEIPGDPAHSRSIEAKVTLPSYQTGIFKAPGMPFKIHIYQNARGFDYDDVNNYYGAADLVPDTIKRTYVSSDLCYDIQTTIRAINDEYRERVLQKETLR